MADCSRGMWALPISNGAKALCALLWTYVDSIEGGVVWASVHELADTTAQGARTVKRQISELKAAGLVAREGRYIRLIKAPRRERGAIPVTPPPDRKGPVLTDEGPFQSPKRATGDTQGNEEGTKEGSPLPPVGGTKPTRRKRNETLVEKWRPQCEKVIDQLNERRRQICEKFGGNYQPLRSGTANCEHIAKRLEDGEALETLLAVVDEEARNCWRKRGSDYRWLNAKTPFRDENYPDRVAQVGAPRPANDAAEVIADAAEAKAWADAHGGQAPAGWHWNPNSELVEGDGRAAS